MRFVLVANNPAADLSGIRPTDAVVQFNHAEHFTRLVEHPGPRVYVWRVNDAGDASGWHGHDPMHDYDGDLHVTLGHHARIEWECERRGWPHRGVTRQPRYGRGIPSTGFWAAAILHRMGIPIVLCGFTHGPAWPGHDWAYEREWFDARKVARIWPPAPARIGNDGTATRPEAGLSHVGGTPAENRQQQRADVPDHARRG